MIRSLTRLSVAACLLAAAIAACCPTPAAAAEPGGGLGGSKLNPANWSMPAGFKLPAFLVPQEDQDRIVKRKNWFDGRRQNDVFANVAADQDGAQPLAA